MRQDVLHFMQSNAKFILALLLALTIATVSARPQFFPAESMESTQEEEIEGRHFIHHHRYNHGRPFAGHRPFGGHFGTFSDGGLHNSGPHSYGAGNFGPNGQFFGPNVGGGSATAVGLANTGNGGGSVVGFGSASGNGGGSAVGFGSASGIGGGQATGIGIAQAPFGGFGMGVGLAVATPFGNMAQGQAFSLG